MAQHDFSIANQGFPAFRSDLNDALESLVTNSSGATEPSTTYAHQFWVDTAANPSVLKQRNADNDAWITIGTINQTSDTFTLTAGLTSSTVDINGGTIDGTAIGGSTASTGAFTTLAASGATTIEVNSSSDALRITQTGSGNAFVVEDSTSPDSSPFVIDASGQVLVGLTTARTSFAGGTVTPQFQIEQVTGGRLSVTRNSNNTGSPDLFLAKTRGTSLGSNDAVINGDPLGVITWQGADGTNLIRAATISAAVDGTPGTNDMPGRLVFSTTADGASSPTERVRIDSAGNVGIGTSSPDAKLDVTSAGSASTYTVSAVIQDGTYPASGYPTLEFSGFIGGNGYRSGVGSIGGQSLAFYTPSTYGVAPTERARIDNLGNLLVGRTVQVNQERLGVETTTDVACITRRPNATTCYMDVYYTSSGIAGFIYSSGTTTSYNTSSDYRLKEDWQPMTGASERVMSLKPVNFAWKVDGSRVDGFLAHEAQEVVPEAVHGVKDAVDAEGKPEYQGIDQSKLVPLLTAALQEALTKIESLTARVSALEGN